MIDLELADFEIDNKDFFEEISKLSTALFPARFPEELIDQLDKSLPSKFKVTFKAFENGTSRRLFSLEKKSDQCYRKDFLNITKQDFYYYFISQASFTLVDLDKPKLEPGSESGMKYVKLIYDKSMEAYRKRQKLAKGLKLF